jgi:translocation and assembly module TamA
LRRAPRGGPRSGRRGGAGDRRAACLLAAALAGAIVAPVRAGAAEPRTGAAADPFALAGGEGASPPAGNAGRAGEPPPSEAPASAPVPAGASDGVAAPAPGPAAPPAEPSRVRRFLSGLPLIGQYFEDPEAADTAGGTRTRPHYLLEVEAPEPVEALIREHTLLGRWRRRPDYDPSQLPLFVRRAPQEVRELLETEGYFAGEVDVREIDGGVRIEVSAGPRTTVNRAELVLGGDVAAPPNDALRERIRREWLLPEGAFFRAPAWDRAKRELLDGLHDAGFLRARIRDSEAIVDLQSTSASLRVDVDSGSRMSFGALRIEGLKRYPASVVEGLRPFERGDPYDTRDMVRFQTLLNGAGWFTTVNVRPDTQALERDPALAEVPIRVDVSERESKRWSLGGGYDTDRGFNVVAGWENRNVGGAGIQTFNGIELDLERQLAYSTWDTPQELDGRRWQFGARIEHHDVTNELVDSGSVFGSRNRRDGDIETAISLQYQTERQSIVFAPGQEQLYDNRALVLGWSWTQRKLDSLLAPTRGYVVAVQLSAASEALGSERSFARAYVFGLGMLPLSTAATGEFGRLLVRGELGSVFADDREGIPSTNLFRTGGTKSVRGYASQSLGVQIGEATVGGRFLAVGSVEYQHLITRDVALAVFYDLGNAADQRSALEPVSGYGVGVRWRTLVGPLNLDLARGDAVGEWRLHFSIGVVF